VFPYRWDLVGQQSPHVVLGKGSGLPSIELWLDELGLAALDESGLNELLRRVKLLSLEEKRILRAEEFRQLYDEVTKALVQPQGA
jgi:isopropylmalate/homocitrate/citramalate synthase